jgi:protein O-GlcNAc transferase
MAQLSLQQTFDLAIQHHQAGRLREAERLYREVLLLNPQHVEAMHNLGLIARDLGRKDEAVDLIRGALALRPDSPEVHGNLSIALRACGKLDEAIAAARRAVALNPVLPEAHYNLGDVLKDNGQLDEAIACYGRAIALRPTYADAHNNLGNAQRAKLRFDDAIAAYRRAISIKPDFADAHYNLGNALRITGQSEQAIVAFRRTIALKPSFAEAFNNLGVALRDRLQIDEAIAAFEQAIVLKPGYAEAYNNIGVSRADQQRPDDAIAVFRQAIAADPHFPEAHSNLGNSLRDKGKLDEAIAAYRQAIALRPTFAEAHSNLLYMLHYHPGYDAQAIAKEHRRWNAQHGEPLRRFIQPHSNDRSPDRPLRIGYVSADFYDHASAFFLVPLLENHDPRQVELICYAQVRRPDETTRRFQRVAQWRSTVGLSDKQVAEQIRQDRIDILVDLKVHTANNRLSVFAYKPAPVQVTWLGCPASTGLTTIDYRLSDPYLDPRGMDESIYSEKTVRLPETFWCYDPLDGRTVPVNTLPVLQKRFITFGCLNTFCKINERVLALWAEVLRQVESSRLLLLAAHGDHRQRTLDQFSQEGVDAERIEFVPPLLRQEYLKQYGRIDLGLDCFPYNGHTTSFDSFWMGVPVVTFVGQTAVSRAGLSQLSNLRLPDLAGHTPEQFVRIAVELAGDLPRLGGLRSTLRSRMEQSPLMNAANFARNVEAAYRRMWHTWCKS